MDEMQIGLAAIFFMLVLIQTGMHVAVALFLLSFIGVWLMKDNMHIAGRLVAISAQHSMQRYEFGVLPLFVVMGLIVSATGMGRDTFDVAGKIFSRMKGGLGMATVSANAIFAAINGTTIASASVFTKVAVPELIRHGYIKRFAVGVVAGSSVLGMLIPPSLLLIIYGVVAETSIGALFTAGILPGLLLSAAFIGVIMIMSRFFPQTVTVPESDENSRVYDDSLGVMAAKISPIIILIVIVLGGIYGGIITPVEAGGVGALAALIIAVIKRALTLRMFWDVLVETGMVTGAIAFLLIAAHVYANMLALSGLPDFISQQMEAHELSFAASLVIYLIIIILLGTILDSASIILILVPLMLPVVEALEINTVWFGIVTIIAVEIGLLTPPLGIACFVIKTNLNDDSVSLGDIFIGAAPFALTMLLVLVIIVIEPWFALALL